MHFLTILKIYLMVFYKVKYPSHPLSHPKISIFKTFNFIVFNNHTTVIASIS
jgi:hypothetical protein